jgi:hypothetical protein
MSKKIQTCSCAPPAPAVRREVRRIRGRLTLGLAVTGVALFATAWSQTPPTAPATTAPAAQVKRPTSTPTAPAAATPAQKPSLLSRFHLPFRGNSNTGANSSTGTTAAAAAAAASKPRSAWNPLNLFHKSTPGAGDSAAAEGARGKAGAPAAATSTHNAAGPTHLASLAPSPEQTSAAHTSQSQMLLGQRALPGTRDTQTAKGNIVRTAADGSVLEVRNPKSGMLISHGLDGNRRALLTQPDGSRVFTASHGVQYVQHPYLFQAHAYDNRTLVGAGGKVSQQFYRPYVYQTTTLDAYAPARFYQPAVYQWANTRYATPLQPSWNYLATPTPWFTYNKGYFVPDVSYASPMHWLTDFVLATSLISAWNAKPPAAGAPPPSASAGITPQVKDMLTDEVGRQVHQEAAEAKENAQGKEPAPGAGGVVQELSDKQPHVFVVASDLDLVDPSGRRCTVTEGDVVQVVSAPKPDTSSADAVVMASKGGLECERATQVQIGVTDLQEMQNHMRETIDQGMANTSEGRQAPTVTPDFAASAPPPDANAAQEIAQQQQIAAAAEG